MPPTSAPPSAPAIQLREVTLTYGRTEVLQDVSFELRSGEITALVGPNGSGKSTLLNAIAGLMPSSQGQILIDGAPPEQRRRQIAYVQQRTEDNRLLPISGREVVRMGRYVHRGLVRRFTAEDHEAVDLALRLMQAEQLADKQLRQMSGGEQQRILIAQGLSQHGDVLLLDEPVTGLDLVSRQSILDVVRGERDAGRAVVMTTHDLADARTADHVVLLAGRVVASGPPDVVLTAANLAAAYNRPPVMVGDALHVDDPHHRH